MLYCVATGRDPNDFEKPAKYATKDAIRAGIEILNRGFGRPLDSAAMRDLERGIAARTVDMTTDELQALITDSDAIQAP